MQLVLTKFKINSLDNLDLLTINPIDVSKNINLGYSLNVIIVLLILVIMVFLGSTLFSHKK